MAEVFSAGAMPAPVTPAKIGPIVQNTELTPEYSPAPTYTKSLSTQDPFVEIQEKLAPDAAAAIIPDNKHPVLPIGNVSIDIRNHLSCHSIFKTNVDTLLKEYIIMKHDLDQARSDTARLEREVEIERSEKKAYKEEAEDLKRDLDETQADLSQTRSELTITQEKLGLSIKQLMETSEKLEKVKNLLREALRERDALSRDLAAKENELQYCKQRIVELELALGLANKGENDANDRNVRLTQLLYEIEAQKASIERAKDMLEKRVRELNDRLRERSGDQGALIKELRTKIIVLEAEIQQLTKERDEARQLVVDRDSTIKHLEDELQKASDTKFKYWELLNEYEVVVGRLPHPRCIARFKHLRNRSVYFNKEEVRENFTYAERAPQPSGLAAYGEVSAISETENPAAEPDKEPEANDESQQDATSAPADGAPTDAPAPTEPAVDAPAPVSTEPTVDAPAPIEPVVDAPAPTEPAADAPVEANNTQNGN